MSLASVICVVACCNYTITQCAANEDIFYACNYDQGAEVIESREEMSRWENGVIC